jgi:hypothetical protein
MDRLQAVIEARDARLLDRAQTRSLCELAEALARVEPVLEQLDLQRPRLGSVPIPPAV